MPAASPRTEPLCASGVCESRVLDPFEGPEPQALQPRRDGPCRPPVLGRWSKRRRAVSIASVALLLVVVAALITYFTVPQLLIKDRFGRADVHIDECIMVIGPDAATQITATARISMARSFLQLPLVSYKAHISAFNAMIDFHEAAPLANIEVGTLYVSTGVDLDSSKDVDMEIGGQVLIPNPREVSRVVSFFVKERNITLRFSATINIRAVLWGWMPLRFSGISVEKYQTLPAFNNFKEKPVQLQEFLRVHGTTGEINVTASANIFNPTPVTTVVNDDFQFQMYYTWQGVEYRVGTLYAEAPVTLRPGDNVVVGMARARPRCIKEQRALEALMTEFIGPQSGISPAGTKPLLIRLADVTSESQLVRAVTQFLSVDVNFRPKPVYFILEVTCDITAFNSVVPPFYGVVLHMRTRNPIPQVVHLNKVQLVAHHLSLEGPVLYRYNHDLNMPKYILQPSQDTTLDFALSLKEVSWDFLFSLKEIEQLMHEAAVRNLTLGIAMDLTLTVEDGYQQVVHYKNEALSGLLCFHTTAPPELCGDLPPSPP